jgi:hypothetical protein
LRAVTAFPAFLFFFFEDKLHSSLLNGELPQEMSHEVSRSNPRFLQNTEGYCFQICEDSLGVLPELINPHTHTAMSATFLPASELLPSKEGLSTLTRLQGGNHESRTKPSLQTHG